MKGDRKDREWVWRVNRDSDIMNYRLWNGEKWMVDRWESRTRKREVGRGKEGYEGFLQ